MPYKDPEKKRQWERIHRQGGKRMRTQNSGAAKLPAVPERKETLGARFKTIVRWVVIGFFSVLAVRARIQNAAEIAKAQVGPHD